MDKKGKKSNKNKKEISKKNYFKLIVSFILFIGAIILFIYIFDGKYTITFDSDGGSTYSSLRVKNGEEVTLPIPEKDGYKFIGWKDESGEYVDAHYKVEYSTTLKADYRLKFVVTFVYNNGEENTTQDVVENQMVIAPSEPVKNGYSFDGWYYNGVKYNFDKAISGNITLEARWKK